MQIGAIVSNSSIYGPGNRFVIWTQGCSIRCNGCWNQQFFNFNAGKNYKTEEIMNLIELEDVEGVTILGGEPFDQAEELFKLVKTIKSSGKTVFLYSGYTNAELLKNQLHAKILAIADIMVLGRYDKDKRDINLRWRGSSNQQVIFNNVSYKEKFENMEEAQEIEIQIDNVGNIEILGYPDNELVEIMK